MPNLRAYGAVTDQGPYLNVNEDAYDYDLKKKLFLVIDAYGGSGKGDKLADELKNELKNFYTTIVTDRDSTLPFFYSPKYLLEANALINAILFTHKDLFKKNMEKGVGDRAGASAVIAVQNESILTLASIGNCKAYICRHGRLKNIFVPDDYELLHHDDFNSVNYSIPLSGFGLFPDIHYQIKEVRISLGDRVILMSDGVYKSLTDDEINYAINDDQYDLRGRINSLFNLSNSRGNKDNQSALILEF